MEGDIYWIGGWAPADFCPVSTESYDNNNEYYKNNQNFNLNNKGYYEIYKLIVENFQKN